MAGRWVWVRGDWQRLDLRAACREHAAGPALYPLRFTQWLTIYSLLPQTKLKDLARKWQRNSKRSSGPAAATN